MKTLSWSIRARLTTLFLVIFGTTLVLLSAIGYRFFSQTQQRDFDAALFNHGVDVASTVDINFFGEVLIPEPPELEADKVFPFSLRRSYMQVLDFQGHVIAKSGNLHDERLPLTAPEYEDVVRRGISLRTIPEPLPESIIPRKDAQTYRLLSYRVDKPSLPKMILQVAAPMTFMNRVQEDIRSFLFIAIPLILAIATAGGLLLSQRALNPVRLIREKADSIHVGNLSERVPVPAHGVDEISELALTFNRLLDRIETTFKANQRFVADASHQLKTPLSVLRGELDLMLRRERSPEEIRAFLVSASQEIDSLTHLAESLLTLARVEAGSASIASTTVRLDEIALEAISRVDSVAREKQIRIRPNLRAPVQADSSFECRGDPDLLGTMILNLVENAIKYSPAGSTIEIQLDDQGDSLLLSVADQGPGIPPEKVKKIFERFYRDPSTKGSARGFGLGLPIAQTIARAHESEILVSRAAAGAGSVFSIRLRK